ncbi:4-(cytidine 5'-diphospho)-2-C-methyl-D-erythritol kinase [Geovibrio thiophilus]|uniref:4-diphosphocytidyl-2-C-methyl-D-erythritol kinase n=1 Tax=Geovibrio thiophilus TaxID=139438 RepID=A0A3R5XZ41_9BACT|nr:4-(cytidine 5'-diphospho)-2-C-methyl-D-erythritol kinase [Geovibrio thiophilus]QAR34270.1 4-(cytidine 5'-diphospho)-2-C-methyl-D-erythritol kinase [Geovibrio thiophilus]
MIIARSYAKINIFLHINGKRADGYHDLQTLFAQTELHDTIEIEEADRTELICNMPDIPADSSNLIIRVKNILTERYGIRNEYRIILNKKIPAGGGLGGGSSNAACFLKTVNSMSHMGLSYKDMADILGSVGSDTVYFLHDRPCYAEGRGEIIVSETELPSAPILLVNPGIHVPTGEIFRCGNLKLTSKADLSRMPIVAGYAELTAMLENGLEAAVFAKHPVLQTLKTALLDSGADGALMSGSGSTVFGIYRTDEQLESACDIIREKFAGYTVFKSRIKGAG